MLMSYSGPTLVYRFRADAAYYRTTINRYYGQRRFLLRLPVQYGFISLIALGIFLWNTRSPSRTVMGIAAVAVVLLTAAMVALTKLSVLYRFKRRPDFGAETTVTVSKEGIASSGHHAHGNWGWQAYPRSVRYRDGILLLRRGVVRWLPDAALQAGTPTDATELVKSKTILTNLAPTIRSRL
jgi:hypothetical protein